MKGPTLSPPAKAEFLNQGRVWIMGVLNATPDSFYPDSRAVTVEDALAKADVLIREGADVLDIGGESTRPGASPVSQQEELDRVLPLVDAIHTRWPDLPLSIDTQKAEVARQALAHGATLINDISAMRQDPEMSAVIAESGAPVLLMHMQGTPRTMQRHPSYRNVMDELKTFFTERLFTATRRGISEDKIILDPGIGFGKSLEHNLTILKNLSQLTVFKRPILVGISRKSFIGKLMGSTESHPLPVEHRLEGTLAATLWALKEHANGFRVHDVGATRQAIQTWQSLQNA